SCCWRKASPTWRFARFWAATPTISVAGRVASKLSGWRACTPIIPDERWRNERRRWRPILQWTRRPAPDGSTHWSSRKLAQHLGVSHMMVARVWQRAGLKPHRIERYMASDDPDFET